MPNSPFILRMAQRTWINHHENITAQVAERWQMTNEPGPSTTDRIGGSALRMQSLLQEAVVAQIPVRPCGARWSFSDIPVVAGGWMIETDQLDLMRFLVADNLDPLCHENAGDLILAQCGASIWQINEALETPFKQRAIRTSGASNGQTIGGALGTGIHGSAIDVGGLESQVAGIQLVMANTIIWLEDPAKPMLNAAYAARLCGVQGGVLIRDAELFRAALVSLGALGVVHAVLLRTAKRYRLNSSIIHLPYSDPHVKTAMNSLIFDPALNLPDPAKRPYFFQTIMNPSIMDTAFTTVRYHEDCPATYIPDYNLQTGHEPGTDVPGLIAKIISILPGLVNPVVSALISIELAEKRNLPPQTPGETYSFTKARRGVESSGFAIHISDVSRALEVARLAFIQNSSAGVVFTCRYVQQSPAILGFTRFGPTCVFDIDGIASQAARRLIRQTAEGLDAAGIRYTQHWGKTNDLNLARVRRGYGNAVDRWNAARARLLPSQAERSAFSSPVLDALGLNA
jgi:hypothetical protein